MVVVGLKNKYPDAFQSQLLVFHNSEEAFAILRRNFRNMYFEGEFNEDEFMEKEIYIIADFDEKEGTFENLEQPIQMSIESMVGDLIGADGNDS